MYLIKKMRGLRDIHVLLSRKKTVVSPDGVSYMLLFSFFFFKEKKVID